MTKPQNAATHFQTAPEQLEWLSVMSYKPDFRSKPMAPSFLTREGLERLKSELDHLQKVKRAEVAERLREAVEGGGDLTENAEYETAKTEQAFIEGRITDLKLLLANTQIIEKNGVSKTVQLGSTVTFQEGDFSPETFVLVGPIVANPREGRISFESPLGKALMNQKTGDTVIVKVPDGDITVRILKIK